jgi:DNA repair protein RadC
MEQKRINNTKRNVSILTSDFTSLDKVTDAEIVCEYVKRFTIPAGERLGSSKSGADHLRAFLMKETQRERFAIIYLNAQNEIIKTEVLFEGSISTSAVYPREVIVKVLENQASRIIIGHNHPSGSTEPSSSDRHLTKKISKALEAIDVDLLDHIIIGGEDYLSFADHRLI